MAHGRASSIENVSKPWLQVLLSYASFADDATEDHDGWTFGWQRVYWLLKYLSRLLFQARTLLVSPAWVSLQKTKQSLPRSLSLKCKAIKLKFRSIVYTFDTALCSASIQATSLFSCLCCAGPKLLGTVPWGPAVFGTSTDQQDLTWQALHREALGTRTLPRNS